MRALRISIATSLALGFIASVTQAQETQPEGESEGSAAPREKVLGIGGFFFRADDPSGLAQWYLEHLGIDRVPTTYEIEPWTQEEGFTVFSPFPRSAEGFAPEGKDWVLNLRVRDLDAMVAQLEAAGIEVEVDPEIYPNGRFAGLSDPEGNPIQLWEAADPRDAKAGIAEE